MSSLYRQKAMKLSDKKLPEVLCDKPSNIKSGILKIKTHDLQAVTITNSVNKQLTTNIQAGAVLPHNQQEITSLLKASTFIKRKDQSRF